MHPVALMLLACRSPAIDDGGRTDGTDPATTPTTATTTLDPTDPTDPRWPTTPWERDAEVSPGSVVFTEVHYHPTDDALEWVELHNPMAFDLDVSGWSLTDGVDWTFPEGSWIPAGGYVVVAADPAALADAGVDDAFGPYAGALDNAGERLALTSNGGRRIDAVRYDDAAPWPEGPDGTGASLTKIRAIAASDHAEHWRTSLEIGGTPGRANGLDPLAPPVRETWIAADATWSYDASGAPPAGWTAVGFDDSAWPAGPATFWGGPTGPVEATLFVTADNYYAAYLGDALATDLRLVAADPDGDWTTVEAFPVEVTETDHLYLAAWEAPADFGGPQMVIAEVDFGGASFGTSASTVSWILGPPQGSPDPAPAAPPPDEAALADAIAFGAWSAPWVDLPRTASPWGPAIQAQFSDAALYVWPDTFDDPSITNLDNTYALFRSVGPVRTPSGTALSPVPTTTAFRTTFSVDGDPATVALTVACAIDDGAVFSLNGAEVLRHNLPAGPIGPTTLASVPVADAAFAAPLPSAGLVPGDNVLAVEVHQAEAVDADLQFGCTLFATRTPPSPPSVRIDEIPAVGGAFWAELYAAAAVDLTGMVLASPAGLNPLSGSLAAGERRVVPLANAPAAGDLLFLGALDAAQVFDAVRALDRPRGRTDAGAWAWPSAPTPGSPNAFAVEDAVVIHEVLYHPAPIAVDGAPVVDRTDEWIELYNRGDQPVDLSGWTLTDAVTFTVPAGTVLAPGAFLVVANDAAAFAAAYPGVAVLGDFGGRLDNDTDTVVLRDAAGNTADAVRYFDDGRWPAAADGGGSSLERRNPHADPAVGETWAASDSGAQSAWVSVQYDAVVGSSPVGPDGQWEELVLGLLDAGEVLIDDLSVVRDPGGAAAELLENGRFDTTERWRILGNHRHSEVIDDPQGTGSVLRLVATGPTEHMHNHAETTLRADIVPGTYRISYRARWISGSNQLHTRLYFNRGARTTLLPVPDAIGTPGAVNSRWEDNLGPSFRHVGQDLAVPTPGQPVQVSASIADPDGVSAVTLWTSVDGGDWVDQPMALDGDDWRGTVAGQPAGSLVQFYLEAWDGTGLPATFPAAGPDSRALISFDDRPPDGNGLHNLRLLVTAADTDWMLDPPNLMSNDAIGATVVSDESEVFYDVGVRTKGSQRGRPETVRLGFGLYFPTEQRFRGSHGSVLLDRSEGVGYGQREVLTNLLAGRAGLVSAEYNDLVHLIAPRDEHTGPAELQLDRFTNLVLDAQFSNGGDGVVHDYELIYYPFTTLSGRPDGQKLPQPDGVIGTALTDLGSDKEAYRWNFGLQNHVREDDYDGIIAVCQTFALPDDAMRLAAPSVIDVDQWLRAFAFATLAGATDNYAVGSQHNAAFYLRPDDGLALYFPHDLDFVDGGMLPVVGNNDLARLIADPVWHRTYYQHLQDLLERAYAPAAVDRWCDQLATLLPAQDVAGHCAYLDTRAAYVSTEAWDGIAANHPEVPFAILTNGGADFKTPSATATLRGEGWIDVHTVWLNGAPLAVRWLDGTTWEVTVPLVPGPNPLDLTATDLGGQPAGSDSVTITRQ